MAIMWKENFLDTKSLIQTKGAILHIFCSINSSWISLAENTFHVYDVTPVDRFTHGLSGMAVTAIILNLYLTRKRQFYYVVSIGASWIAFILWEVYELIYIAYSGLSGFIQSDSWDIVIDLWIDSLGALAICFLYAEFTEN